MTRANMLFLAIAASASILAGCITGGSSGSNANPPGIVVGSKAYKVEGDRIITVSEPDTNSFCSGNSLVTPSDTQSTEDTMEFHIEKGLLKLYTWLDTKPSGAMVQYILIGTRSGNGSGLEGTWAHFQSDYIVVSGSLTTGEKASIDSDMAMSRYIASYSKYAFVFANGTLTYHLDENSSGLILDSWNGVAYGQTEGPDSAQYDMTAKAVDAYTVEYKGRKTGETVRVADVPLIGITYTSDQPDHAEYRLWYNPQSCPNPIAPDWYNIFRTNNMKSPHILEKITQNRPKSHHDGHFYGLPLKSPTSLLN